jgi:hypothetical protein
MAKIIAELIHKEKFPVHEKKHIGNPVCTTLRKKFELDRTGT